MKMKHEMKFQTDLQRDFACAKFKITNLCTRPEFTFAAESRIEYQDSGLT